MPRSKKSAPDSNVVQLKPPAETGKSARKRTTPTEAPPAEIPASASKRKATKSKEEGGAERSPKSPAARSRKKTAATTVETTDATTATEAPLPVRKQPEIRVFQVYFDEKQKSRLDKHFTPLNNAGVKDPLLEVGVMRRLHRSEHTKGLKYWGVVSWKFEEKMSINGKTLLTYILRNPGYDVYFCNPFVEVEALYQNLWVQGAVAHPEFLKVCDAVFRGVGMDPKTLSRPMPSTLFATANFFVATPKFWDAYMAYIDDFLVKVNKLPAKLKAILVSANADPGGLHHGVSYLPFIVERLFSEFLADNIGKYKALKVKSPALEKRQTVYYNNLRMLKDAAIVGKSDWMLDCWSNYRKVLMGSIHGKAWMEKHLSIVNFLSNDYIGLKA